MTALAFAKDDAKGGAVRPLHLVSKERLSVWMSMLDAPARVWLEATGFTGAAGEVALIPGDGGSVAAAAGGLGDMKDRRRKRFVVADIRGRVAAGDRAWRRRSERGGAGLVAGGICL